MKKKILVFGAAGFIGTYLVEELLRQNFEVIASDICELGEKFYKKRNVQYISVDINSKSDFRKLENEQFDVIIHLAALQPANYREPDNFIQDYIKVNVLGTLNVLEYCDKTNSGKIIYASSHRNTSGLWCKKEKIREVNGRSQQYKGEYAMFSISETAAQDCVNYYNETLGIKGIIFRLPPVYGFGPHLEIFKNGKPVKTGFQTFIDNAKQCIPLEVWGDTNVGRDIIYVKDVVSAFLKVINSDKANGLYNISSSYLLTLKEEVETIARVFWGNSDQPQFLMKPEKTHSMDSFVYDNTKAGNDFGWSPKYNFEEMLFDYIRELEKDTFGFLVTKRSKMFNIS